MEKTDCIVVVSFIFGFFFCICFGIFTVQSKVVKALKLGYVQTQSIGNVGYIWTK